MSSPTPALKKPVLTVAQLEEALKTAIDHKRFRKIDYFSPYPKQREFLAMGLTVRERLLMAGNQNGKTYTGAAEMAFHLTGEYPWDWEGRRFDHPILAWITGETGVVVRDKQQLELCGTPGVEEDFGTGMIPKERFTDKPSSSRGVQDAYDTIHVEHRTNGKVDGVSSGVFKSYEQGRKKFQAASVDVVWFDEEPPEDIYSEGLTRTVATGGIAYLTFTPLQGMSTVVLRFLEEESEDRGVVIMTIDDAEHISPAQKAIAIAGYLPHEREARARGVPMLGSGRIFTVAEETITEPDLTYLPRHWVKFWGIDFGIDHPFAAVLFAWDKDNDVIHLITGFKIADQLPIMHAARMKPIGGQVPVAWPQDGTARSKGDGEVLSKSYSKQGLHMMPTHAVWPDGSISTEAGVLEMQERMSTGRFKVAASFTDFFEEYRMYHRKDGMIVKLRDDILSAARIGIMMKRFGRPVDLGGPTFAGRRSNDGLARDVDFDPWAG